MKVSELSGTLLDYWVASANGWVFGPQHKTLECDVWRNSGGEIVGTIPASAYQPSQDWSQGGPIIERIGIDLQVSLYESESGKEPLRWVSKIEPGITDEMDQSPRWIFAEGETPLIAAMRAYVASKFGDEVPDAVS